MNVCIQTLNIVTDTEFLEPRNSNWYLEPWSHFPFQAEDSIFQPYQPWEPRLSSCDGQTGGSGLIYVNPRLTWSFFVLWLGLPRDSVAFSFTYLTFLRHKGNPLRFQGQRPGSTATLPDSGQTTVPAQWSVRCQLSVPAVLPKDKEATSELGPFLGYMYIYIYIIYRCNLRFLYFFDLLLQLFSGFKNEFKCFFCSWFMMLLKELLDVLLHEKLKPRWAQRRGLTAVDWNTKRVVSSESIGGTVSSYIDSPFEPIWRYMILDAMW